MEAKLVGNFALVVAIASTLAACEKVKYDSNVLGLSDKSEMEAANRPGPDSYHTNQKLTEMNLSEVSSAKQASESSAQKLPFYGKWECRQYFQDGDYSIKQGEGDIETYSEAGWGGTRHQPEKFTAEKTERGWKLLFTDGSAFVVEYDTGKLFRGTDEHVYVCLPRS